MKLKDNKQNQSHPINKQAILNLQLKIISLKFLINRLIDN